MTKNSSIRISVAGASGYAGGELLRYLAGHPQAELVHCYGHSRSGEKLSSLWPGLRGFFEDQVLQTPDWSEVGKGVDLVFLCLPHGQSQEPVAQILQNGARVIDLGADFRLQSAALYQGTYGEPHTQEGLLEEAVYGMPEIHRARIKGARLVANPGCYPTASILALLPLARAGLLEEPSIIDAKSGVSGAGRGAKVTSLYAEVNESLKPYGVGGHRHQPEIEQSVGQKVVFTPHLVPMTRGILATVYARHQPTDLQALYEDFYQDEPFVRVLRDELPATGNVLASNFCDIAVRPSGYPGCSVVMSAIDNLGKGASGGAVHNMNLLFGLKETTGLQGAPVFP